MSIDYGAFGNQVVKIIFYTPEAEMTESEAYVSQMSYFTRALRSMAHLINILNATYTSKILCKCEHIGGEVRVSHVESDDGDVAIDYESFDAQRIVRSIYNTRESPNVDEFVIRDLCIGSCKTVSGKEVMIYDISTDGTVMEWTVGNKTYYKGNFCHAEIIMGDNSYFIRWASTVTRQRHKQYNNAAMIYKVMDIHMEAQRYALLLNYMESCIEANMGFNYLGLYTNFTLPDYIKTYLFANGANYQCNNGTFCSEFITMALAECKLLKNLHQREPIRFYADASNQDHSTTVTTTILMDDDRMTELKHGVLYSTDIRVNASLVSPNDLYLLLSGLSIIVMDNSDTPVMVTSGVIPHFK